MKTSEEIKKGLECCQHNEYNGLCECDKGCPYRFERCDQLRKDALAYIQQLEIAVEYYSNTTQMLDAKIAKLESRLAQVERERDAALRDMMEIGWCQTCTHYNVAIDKEPCKTCLKKKKAELWQWRGVCPENTKEE